MVETGFPEGSSVIGHTITVNFSPNGQWFKVAEITMPNRSDNKHIVFYVHDGMYSNNAGEHVAEGILNVMLRTMEPGSFTEYGCARAEWLIADEHTAINSFCLEVNNTTGNAQLWTFCTGANSIQFTVIAEGDRFDANKHYFTLYDKPQPGTKPTADQGYTEIKSTVAKLLTPTSTG